MRSPPPHPRHCAHRRLPLPPPPLLHLPSHPAPLPPEPPRPQPAALPRRRLRGNRIPPFPPHPSLSSHPPSPPPPISASSSRSSPTPSACPPSGPIPGPSSSQSSASAPPPSTTNSTALARSSSPSSRLSPPPRRALLLLPVPQARQGVPRLHPHALLTALLSRGGNDTMVHYMYMDTVSALFRQMLEEGIPPDTRSVNVLVKGYAQSLHLNDALRVFHQMVPRYGCEPDAFTYSYLVHGLSAQGRTKNARELFEEMRAKGMVPTEPSCNAFVSALAVAGEVAEAERVMWEMARAGTVVDHITRRAVVEELGRAGKKEDADRVVKKMEEMGILRVAEQRELLGSIRDGCGDGGLDADESVRDGDRRRQSS